MTKLYSSCVNHISFGGVCAKAGHGGQAWVWKSSSLWQTAAEAEPCWGPLLRHMSRRTGLTIDCTLKTLGMQQLGDQMSPSLGARDVWTTLTYFPELLLCCCLLG